MNMASTCRCIRLHIATKRVLDELACLNSTTMQGAARWQASEAEQSLAPYSPQNGVEGVMVASHIKYGFFRQTACSLEALNHASVYLSASNAQVSWQHGSKTVM